jgi:hypothetical protein
LFIAAAIWLPLLHFFFARQPAEYFSAHGVPPLARKLAARHLRLWTDPALRDEEVRKMRVRNAEWDFMGRSFLVWSFANMGLRDPASKATALGVMDRIIDETLRLERDQGVYHFLLPYAHDGEFAANPPRSLFLDGEIALMLASRRMLEEKAIYKPLLAERVSTMVERMKQSPVLSAESYPNECWTFCNTVALASIRVADCLDGTDHSEFLRDWVSTAKTKLVDPKTGLLVSMYTPSGRHLYGPEGSTIWMASHCLQIVDGGFAAEQYARARRELGRTFLGFGYAREWPASWPGEQDVDSGPVVPLLGISAGSSGLAFVGASAFGDGDFLSSLRASLDFAGFPSVEQGGLRYCASNQVGDAVLLYATVLGPMWDRAKAGAVR